MTSVHAYSPETILDRGAAKLHALVSFVENSPIRLPELAAPTRVHVARGLDRVDTGRCEGILVAARSADRAQPVARPAATWAMRYGSDIDGAVLRWIASHVKGKKRRVR